MKHENKTRVLIIVTSIVTILLALAAWNLGYGVRSIGESSESSNETQTTHTGVTEVVETKTKAPVSGGFRELCDRSLNELPTRVDAKAAGARDAHHGFGIVVRAGEILGKIAQELHKHPEYVEEGKRFYQRCAENALMMTYVRALCLADLRNLDAGKNGKVGANIPDHIQELANQVPSS
jgi:hypothetical protein